MKVVHAVAGIVIAVIIIGGAAYVMARPQTPERSFYVVAYHWGFVVFDENGVELDQISVAKGTRVTLYAINAHALDAAHAHDTDTDHAHDADHAHVAFNGLPEAIHGLPEAVHSAIENIDFHEMSETENIIPEPEDTTLQDKIEEAEDQGLEDHGLGIKEFLVMVDLEAEVTELSKMSFIADKTGKFEFVCTVDCGYGHIYMAMLSLIVV